MAAKISMIGHFDNKPQRLFLFKKTEAIVSAIYLLSGLLSDSEPLKWRLRTIGADTIEVVLSFLDSGVARVPQGIDLGGTIERDATLLCSLLEILVRGRALSGKNVDLVTREIELWTRLFADVLSGSVEKILDETELFFAGPASTDGAKKMVQRSPIMQRQGSRRARVFAIKGSESDAHDGNGSLAVPRGAGLPLIIQSNSSVPQQRASIVRSSARDSGRITRASDADQRRSVILDLVRARGMVTVKDIARLLPQYSGKTAQRELVGLVGEGVLRREGARRWSSYSMNAHVP